MASGIVCIQCLNRIPESGDCAIPESIREALGVRCEALPRTWMLEYSEVRTKELTMPPTSEGMGTGQKQPS